MIDRTELANALRALTEFLPADAKPPSWASDAWDDVWLRDWLMLDLPTDHPARHDRVTFMVWLTVVTPPVIPA